MSSENGSPGRALVERILGDMRANGLEPDGREVELLDLARRLADRLAALERSIEADGLSSRLESGRIVANPLVAEARQTASAMARVLAGVQMSDTSKDAVKQAAAQARWRAHNAAKAAVRG